jgi:hypothetical protein
MGKIRDQLHEARLKLDAEYPQWNQQPDAGVILLKAANLTSQDTTIQDIRNLVDGNVDFWDGMRKFAADREKALERLDRMQRRTSDPMEGIL